MKKLARIVCTLAARERPARMDQWIQLMRRSHPRVAISDNGVTIHFDHANVRPELEALVL
jgi:hypothetical protein